MPLVDDLARNVRQPLVEGGVGEGGVARDNLDEHAVRGVILWEERQEAGGCVGLLVGGVQEGVAPYLCGLFCFTLFFCLVRRLSSASCPGPGFAISLAVLLY